MALQPVCGTLCDSPLKYDERKSAVRKHAKTGMCHKISFSCYCRTRQWGYVMITKLNWLAPAQFDMAMWGHFNTTEPRLNAMAESNITAGQVQVSPCARLTLAETQASLLFKWSFCFPPTGCELTSTTQAYPAEVEWDNSSVTLLLKHSHELREWAFLWNYILKSLLGVQEFGLLWTGGNGPHLKVNMGVR